MWYKFMTFSLERCKLLNDKILVTNREVRRALFKGSKRLRILLNRHFKVTFKSEVNHIFETMETLKTSGKRCIRLYHLTPVIASAVFMLTIILNSYANDKVLYVNDTPVGLVSNNTMATATQIIQSENVAVKPVYNALTADGGALALELLVSSNNTEEITPLLPVLSSDAVSAIVEEESNREQEELDILYAAIEAQEARDMYQSGTDVEGETESALMVNTDEVEHIAADTGADDVPVLTVETPNGRNFDLINELSVVDFDDDKITAFAVYIDDTYIGAVTDVTPIERALDMLRAPYLTDDIIAVTFDKRVTYDKEIEISESALTDPEEVVDKILATEGVTRYYEVVPGDCPSTIAGKLGITQDELSKLPVTMNGEAVSDIFSDCRVGMQIEYASQRKFIHVLVKKDVTYTDMTPYETQIIEDDTVPEGVVKVQTAGEYGEVSRTCREIWFEDTVRDSQELSVNVLKYPVTEVVIKGTMKTKTTVTTYSKNKRGTYYYPVGNHEGYYSAYMGDGRGHKGVDIAAPYGTPIYAAASGTITKAVTSGWGSGYGKHIVISNDDGNTCRYGHMSYLAEGIEYGDYVVAGQLIGYVGSTGDSTGNHLHFEVITSDSTYVNPLDYID